ncbi:MAG: hypothetical protein JWL95_1541, partial [Gemmatimonadetes bacterium]|nr:hypothetical protein [Gemmatimonadota bacterium]
ISERSLREHHTPTITTQDQSMREKALADSGAAFDRAFREAVVAHHRETIRMMDEYYPTLSLLKLKLMVQRMRRDLAREISEIQRNLGAA